MNGPTRSDRNVVGDAGERWRKSTKARTREGTKRRKEWTAWIDRDAGSDIVPRCDAQFMLGGDVP
jgi:hypothetical protein